MAQGYATLTTAPSVEPLSVADAKTHMRVDTDDDDTYIGTLITVARMAVEHRTRRALITQTWTQYLDSFPNVIEPIMPPIQSVTSIIYTDENGTTGNTWGSTAYQTDLIAEPARIAPVEGETYPSVQAQTFNPIALKFITGYGDAATDVPDALIHAVKLLVAHWYEQREQVVVGVTITKIPDTVEALIAQYAMPEFA